MSSEAEVSRKAICSGGISHGPEWSLTGGCQLDVRFHRSVARHASELEEGDLLLGFFFEVWGSLCHSPIKTGLGRRSFHARHSQAGITIYIGREVVEGTDELKRTEYARLIRAGAAHLHEFLVKKTGREFKDFTSAIDRIADDILADTSALLPRSISDEELSEGIAMIESKVRSGKLTQEAGDYFKESLLEDKRNADSAFAIKSFLEGYQTKL